MVQNSNFSWFGYPDDTEPSTRNFFPGLHKASPNTIWRVFASHNSYVTEKEECVVMRAILAARQTRTMSSEVYIMRR